MKNKGISLIVLVITIIVLAILATTVIISLSNTNIITEASDAVKEYNVKQAEGKLSVAFSAWTIDNPGKVLTSIAELESYGFTSADIPNEYEAVIQNGTVKIQVSTETKITKAMSNWQTANSGKTLIDVHQLASYGFTRDDVPEGKVAVVKNGNVELQDTNVWDGTVATAFAGGTGTIEDPYQISTGAELAYLGLFEVISDPTEDPIAPTHFKLTSNIDLNNLNWTPISPSFLGSGFCTLEGNNFTISNLNIQNASGNAALFDGLMGFEVKNLNISGGIVFGKMAAGVAINGDPVPNKLYNVNNYGVTVNATDAAYGIFEGCFSNVENCVNTGKVDWIYTDEVGASKALGIGEYPHGDGIEIKNCVNYGEVQGILAAGISYQFATYTTTVTNCINYGKIYGSSVDPIELVEEVSTSGTIIYISNAGNGTNQNYGEVTGAERTNNL